MPGFRSWILASAATVYLLAAQIPAGSSLAEFPLERTLELKGDTRHVQGIEVDGDRLWLTSVDSPARKGYLFEFSLSNGAKVREVELSQGNRFHPGGIAADGESLWVPVAEYRRESSSVIQKRSKRTLAVELEFEVADHIGCVAAGAPGLVGGNWDSRVFYLWDAKGDLQRKIPNPSPNAYQDIKFSGSLLVASGLLPDRSGAIDWLDFSTLRLRKRIIAGQTDRGFPYTREGMAIAGDRIYLLPEDQSSRLFVFRLPH